MAETFNGALSDVTTQARSAAARVFGAYGFALEQLANALYEVERVARNQPAADASHEWDTVVAISRIADQLRKAAQAIGPLPTHAEPEASPSQSAVEKSSTLTTP